MIYIMDKQYILDNYATLQFECTDKVGLVRDYLEKECGFKHDSWSTRQYEWLNWLNIKEFKNTVHGGREPDFSKTKCNIDFLLGISILDLHGYKLVNLKD